MDFCKLTKEFWEIYFSGTELETRAKAIEWIVPQCVVIGTGAHEFYLSKDELLHSLEDEVKERENIQFRYKDLWCEQMQLGSDTVLVYGKIHIWWESEDKSIYINMDSRFTFLYQKISGVWKVVHIHQSMPNQEQAEGEIYPKTLKAKVEEITVLAQNDSLTGLSNFRFFGEQWKQRSKAGWMFILDVDKFKEVNDTYGHVIGNEVLVSMADIIKSVMREDDLACRMGGDEFLIFCSGMKDKASATKFAHRLMQNIRKGGTDKEYWTTVSIGAAYAHLDTELEVALENADRSLYYIKRTHRGDFSVNDE